MQNSPEDKPKDEAGQLYPRTYKECPVCHSPSGFADACMKEEFTPEELKKHNPYFHAFQSVYTKGLYEITLTAFCEICAKCGVMYTIARDKKKKLLLNMPAPPKPPPFGGFSAPFRRG